MLLRASGEREDKAFDLSTVTSAAGDSGVAHSDVLRGLTEAAIGRKWSDLEQLRSEASEILGEQAMIDALTVAAGFNGITRVADSTGIPLDANTRETTEEMRLATGIENFTYHSKSDRYDQAIGN